MTGHTATITLNRPEALNALSPHMITELRAAYDEAENDDGIWLMIVTGTGGRSARTSRRYLRTAKVIYERPYLSTYDQWEAPQEGTRRSAGWPNRCWPPSTESVAAQGWTG